MTDLKNIIRAAKESAWDECVASLVYHDGTPVHVAANTNPYRAYPHVGTIDAATLADLDPHDRQAREAVEQ